MIQENLERARWRRRCIKECAPQLWRKSLERSLMQRASGHQCESFHWSIIYTVVFHVTMVMTSYMPTRKLAVTWPRNIRKIDINVGRNQRTDAGGMEKTGICKLAANYAVSLQWIQQEAQLLQRPRDASCLSVVSFNSTITLSAIFYYWLLRLQICRYVQLNTAMFSSLLYVVVAHAAGCDTQYSLMRRCLCGKLHSGSQLFLALHQS